MSTTVQRPPANAYDWTQFVVTMYYRADPDLVWRAWSTPDGLESFFIERCEATTPDGRPLASSDQVTTGTRFRWTWRQGIAIDGHFTEVAERGRVAFTFGDMHVAVGLCETPDGVRVDLHQTEIPDTPDGRVRGHLNCRSCWIHFLTNLASILASDTDLRHPNPTVVSSMEVGFTAPTPGSSPSRAI